MAQFLSSTSFPELTKQASKQADQVPAFRINPTRGLCHSVTQIKISSVSTLSLVRLPQWQSGTPSHMICPTTLFPALSQWHKSADVRKSCDGTRASNRVRERCGGIKAVVETESSAGSGHGNKLCEEGTFLSRAGSMGTERLELLFLWLQSIAWHNTVTHLLTTSTQQLHLQARKHLVWQRTTWLHLFQIQCCWYTATNRVKRTCLENCLKPVRTTCDS